MILTLLLALGAPSTGTVLTCTAKTDGPHGAGTFQLSFTADAGKISHVAVSDPQMVLDPEGNLPVFEYSGGRMTRSTPRRPKLRFTGTGGPDGDLTFASADRVMSITLTLTPQQGGYAYGFTGWRMMDSSLRTDLAGAGSCTVAGAPA